MEKEKERERERTTGQGELRGQIDILENNVSIFTVHSVRVS